MVDRTFLEKYITVKAGVQGGKPCIRGTRTPVHIVLEALAMGMTSEEIKGEYAPLSEEAIRACILYASLLANEEEYTPLSA